MNFSYLFQFLKSHLVATLIVSAVFIYCHMTVYDSLQEQTVLGNNKILTDINRDIDGLIELTLNDTNRLILEEDLKSLRTTETPLKGPSTIRVMNLQKNMAYYYRENNLISDAYLLLKKGELAVNSRLICSLDQLFRAYLNYDGIPPADTEELLLGQKRHMATLPLSPINFAENCIAPAGQVLTLYRTLETGGDVYGAVVVLINASYIAEMCRGIDLSDGGFLAIRDATGRILLIIDEQGFRNPEKQYAPPAKPIEQNRTSPLTSWTYTVVQSSRTVFSPLYELRRGMIFLVILGLLLGVVLAFARALSEARYFQRLNGMLTGREGYASPKGNVRNQFSRSLQTVVEQKEEQIRFQEREFIRLLAMGSQAYRDFPGSLTRYLKGGTYRFAILFSSGVEFSDRWLLLTGSVRRLTPLPYRETGDGGIAFILMDHVHETSLTEEILRWQEELDLELFLGVGFAVSSPDLLYRSYESAMKCRDRQEYSRSVAFAAKDSHDICFDFSPSRATQLLNAVKSGSVTEAAALLDEIEDDHREALGQSLDAGALLFNALLAVLIDIAGSTLVQRLSSAGTPPVDRAMAAIRCDAAPKDKLEKLREIFLETTCLIAGEKQSHNVVLIENILSRIEEDFADPQLSLISLAEFFSLSSPYLSRFIKEQTGETFQRILENRRIDFAAETLASGKYQVKEVAYRSGFTSHASFSRCFKRVTGVSPSSYTAFP